MVTVREAILEGAKEAARLHDKLGIRHAVESGGDRVDIFGTLLRLGVSLIFRPLEGRLGAFLSKPTPGVVISTQRPLPIQRFTGGHELGHFILGHDVSVDGEEILTRISSISGRQGQRTLAEIAADAFAAEFLMPLWLLQMHGRRQDWNRDSMMEPIKVYQLSLRIGASYEAACRALLKFKIVDETVFQSLIAIQPKAIKQVLLDDYYLGEWYPDVWLLTSRDEGAVLEGGPNDLFVLKLPEKSGAGYLWDVHELNDAGFAVVRDERTLPVTPDNIGGAIMRTVIAQSDATKTGRITLKHCRPWQKTSDPLEQLSIGYEFWGKEEGMSRAQRRELRAA